MTRCPASATIGLCNCDTARLCPPARQNSGAGEGDERGPEFPPAAGHGGAPAVSSPPGLRRRRRAGNAPLAPRRRRLDAGSPPPGRRRRRRCRRRRAGNAPLAPRRRRLGAWLPARRLPAVAAAAAPETLLSRPDDGGCGPSDGQETHYSPRLRGTQARSDHCTARGRQTARDRRRGVASGRLPTPAAETPTSPALAAAETPISPAARRR
jgi:hypothetical protein